MSDRALRALPLVAIGYGPRCVPVLQLVEAATGICDVLWLVNEELPEMAEMGDLLRRFGPVIDTSGIDVPALARAVEEHNPGGMITLLDHAMADYAAVAEQLGLAFHAPSAASKLTDKALQRAALDASGLPGPRWIEVPDGTSDSLSDDAFQQATENFSWPAILKPRSAQGSHHAFIAKDLGQVASLLDALGANREAMILEEYLVGDPTRGESPYADYLSVESVVAGGVISHLACTGRFPLAENLRETGFFIPAALTPDDETAALTLATEAINAMGETTGCLHTEIKFTADGPRIIEINGRIGGGVHEMLFRAAGFPLLELMFKIAIGEAVLVDGPVPTNAIGYRFFLQPPPMSATIGRIEGLDEVADFPGVDSVSVHQGPGDDFDWKDGSRNHILAVAGSAENYEELLQVNRLLHERVTVTYSEVVG